MNRRKFLTLGGASIVAAPAIVRAASLMPIRGIVMEPPYGISPAILGLRHLSVADAVDWDAAARELARLFDPLRFSAAA